MCKSMTVCQGWVKLRPRQEKGQRQGLISGFFPALAPPVGPPWVERGQLERRELPRQKWVSAQLCSVATEAERDRGRSVSLRSLNPTWPIGLLSVSPRSRSPCCPSHRGTSSHSHSLFPTCVCVSLIHSMSLIHSFPGSVCVCAGVSTSHTPTAHRPLVSVLRTLLMKYSGTHISLGLHYSSTPSSSFPSQCWQEQDPYPNSRGEGC